MNKFIVDLNKEQKNAVLHEGSPLAIIAGAGTGKT
jgi:superfamily I DNA/RNA helicase